MSSAPESPSSALPFAGAMAGWGDLFKAFIPASATAANPAVPMPGVQTAMPPGLAHWLTPSANPQELDKRIEDLKTVKFWLDQNATLVDNTIRALEVQRLTMATLQNMNVPLQSMMDAMAAPWAHLAQATAAAPTTAAEAPAPAAPPQAAPAPAPAPQASPAPASESATADAAAALPTQWWNDMTGQFARLAQAVVQQGQAAVQATVEQGQALVPKVPAAPKPARKTAAKPAAKAAPKAAAKPAAAAKAAPVKTAAKAAAKPAAGRKKAG
ncbi:PhaM family polyhydroxyalkanoate granule multifunctional regulatory protein [Amphibiibacter pelophylacis]|uniref:Uncharacterized protein n=1 Tax=Amphibiibacter pelophylacis TaxID=1799477 RepID=A0ACC6P1Q6_9BURK